MPRTKLERYAQSKRDSLKGLVLEYMSTNSISKKELANKMKCSRSTITRRMNEHSDEWPIKFVKQVSKEIKIPPEEVRQAARF